MELYRNQSSHALYNAQRNLAGRTHYVDQETLRFHKSRVISARVVDNGLLFAIVTSDSLDYKNTKRGFRYVVFDVFGTVLDRPTLDAAFRTSALAEKAMWAYVNTLDAKAHTLAAIARKEQRHALEMSDLRTAVAKLVEVAA